MILVTKTLYVFLFLFHYLHITAQSGPRHRSHYIPLALVLPRDIKGSMILITKTSDQTRQRDPLSLLLSSSYLNQQCLGLPSLISFFSSEDYLGQQLLNQHVFALVVFHFPPKSTPFPT